MKKYVHKIASYLALILISVLPLPVDVFAEDNKKHSPFALSHIDKTTIIVKKGKTLVEK